MKSEHFPNEPLRRVATSVPSATGAPSAAPGGRRLPGRSRVVRPLVLLPAYNEAANLPSVVAEIRTAVPGIDILVVDDGSDDRTKDLLPRLGVRWLRLGQRLGTGVAVRTGLRYARSRNYDAVIRLDSDGQHPADVIMPLLAPLAHQTADVVVGSRYLQTRRPVSVPFVRRLLHYLLGRVLTLVTGRLVTDPTSGLWAFGPRAVDLLADHHPSGYPEPELHMFLTRNGLNVQNVPVTMRERQNGRTSLTLRRTTTAIGRMVLHLTVVPFRSAVRRRA